MIWAPSKHCFLVGKSTSKRQSFSIPRKVENQPAKMLKWLIFTRRSINKYLESGEVVKAVAEEVEDIGTDEEV